ncbi:MAG TPA: phage holin family protein [Polyangiaceae bacterium]
MQMLPWYYLAACVVLLVLGGVMLARAQRELERRVLGFEATIHELEHQDDMQSKTVATVREDLSKTDAELRRAHVRIDNDQRQIKALGSEMGWSDDRAHTKVLTSRLPKGSNPR